MQDNKTVYLIAINGQTEPFAYQSLTEICKQYGYSTRTFYNGKAKAIIKGNYIQIIKAEIVPRKNRGKNNF